MRSAAQTISVVPERSTDLLDHVDYRLAETPEEKDRIYHLRYRAYLREGAILPSESERVTDRYDDLPNAWTFGVFLHGELYSSIRISVLSSEWRGSPSSEMFGDLIHPELDRGKIIIDPTRFVADPEKAKRFPELPYVTVRLGYVACGYFNADVGLANVRPEHQAFYRRVFLQEPWGEPRLYPGPDQAGRTDGRQYSEMRERVFQRYPYMRSSAFERRMLFEPQGRAYLACVGGGVAGLDRAADLIVPAPRNCSPARPRIESGGVVCASLVSPAARFPDPGVRLRACCRKIGRKNR